MNYFSLHFIRVESIVIECISDYETIYFGNISRKGFFFPKSVSHELCSLLLYIKLFSLYTRKSLEIFVEFSSEFNNSIDVMWLEFEDLHYTCFDISSLVSTRSFPSIFEPVIVS